jgi:hypothetical protein
MGQAVSATKHMTGTNRPRAVLVHAPVDERLDGLVARESIDGTTVVPEIPTRTFANMYISITVWGTVVRKRPEPITAAAPTPPAALRMFWAPGIARQKVRERKRESKRASERASERDPHARTEFVTTRSTGNTSSVRWTPSSVSSFVHFLDTGLRQARVRGMAHCAA